MGLKDRLVENRRRKLVEYVAERLETDDPVEASLPMTQSKNPLAPGVRFYGIAVLPSQVVVVGYPKLVEIEPGGSTWDRELVGVVHHRHGRFGAGELFLKTPDGEFRVEVPRIHRDDADAIVAALGGAPPA